MAAVNTGTVNSGNAVSPWATEAERKAANNAALAPYGISADMKNFLFDSNKNYVNPGVAPDGMGGAFNPAGNSSNKNYLQGTIGVNRNQLAGTGIEGLSDKALSNAYTVNSHLNNALFANDLWVDPVSGSISSAKSANSVSVGDVRNALAKLTGQQYQDLWGASAPFVKPDYYDGNATNTGTMATRQQDLINSLTKQAMTAYNAAVGVKPTTPTDTQAGGSNASTSPSAGLDEEELRRYIASLIKAGGKW